MYDNKSKKILYLPKKRTENCSRMSQCSPHKFQVSNISIYFGGCSIQSNPGFSHFLGYIHPGLKCQEGCFRGRICRCCGRFGGWWQVGLGSCVGLAGRQGKTYRFQETSASWSDRSEKPLKTIVFWGFLYMFLPINSGDPRELVWKSSVAWFAPFKRKTSQVHPPKILKILESNITWNPYHLYYPIIFVESWHVPTL